LTDPVGQRTISVPQLDSGQSEYDPSLKVLLVV
jgi:hypothetical protein